MATQASAVIDFTKNGGVIPVIAQDYRSHRVLMLAYMNREAFEETVRSGDVTFYSRSRRKLWKKGETSGHTLRLIELRIDCDNDSVLARVELRGPGACHQGFRSCFFRRFEPGGSLTTDAPPAFDPAEVYREGQR